MFSNLDSMFYTKNKNDIFQWYTDRVFLSNLPNAIFQNLITLIFFCNTTLSDACLKRHINSSNSIVFNRFISKVYYDTQRNDTQK